MLLGKENMIVMEFSVCNYSNANVLCRSIHSELTQRLVQKTFDGETNLECFVQAVKLLQNVLDSDFWKSSQITPDAYWKRLVHHLTHKHSQSVTECVIPLMGTLLAQVNQIDCKLCHSYSPLSQSRR